VGLFADGPDGIRIYRHGGFWGLHAAVDPDRGLAVAHVGFDQAMTEGIARMIENLAVSARDGR
jgi:hypothetical protein